MCIADPCYFSTVTVDPTLILAAAYPTVDLSRKREPVLVLSVLPYDAFFFASLSDQAICFIEIFAAYDRIVVFGYQIGFYFSVVVMAPEGFIGIGLLKQNIADIFFVDDNISHSRAGPVSAFPCGDALLLQSGCDCISAISGKKRSEDKSHNAGFNYHISVFIPLISVGNVPYLICSSRHSPLDRPLFVF
ncbi:MAG: hypothetical protein BWZ04_03248 [Firmicutes bacterium ADurb.BinA205]|nr:MAG: hypothetical protein BWZ04_03248 [Firmicutes bacterium ADurb.BinA205]